VAKVDGSTAIELVRKLTELGIEGKAPGMKRSIGLAVDFLKDARFPHHHARITSPVRWEAGKTAGSGFVTGLGGLITPPIALPAGVGAAWVVQARMVGAIAHIRSYDLDDERVRTVALAAIAGDSTVTQVTKALGADFATRAGRAAVGRVPGKALIEINKKVGFRLLTKSGTTGVVNRSKAMPILGGVVGGVVDGTATRAVGAVARRAFPDTTTAHEG
jgi:uncharacterized protein (DUF697 family)